MELAADLAVRDIGGDRWVEAVGIGLEREDRGAAIDGRALRESLARGAKARGRENGGS